MKEPATAPWDLSISDADFVKLAAGYEPQDSDDKWRVSVTHQSRADTISIHLIRSWTDTELYRLIVKPSNGGGTKIKAITWEQNQGGIQISEEQAKKSAVILARRGLECDFDALPEYNVSDLWDHPAAQIGASCQ